MTANANEELLALITKLKQSQQTKDQSIMLLGDLLSSIINNNVPLDQRWSMGLTINSYTKRVEGVDRVATGFLGNWAKTHEEAQQKRIPLDPYDVDDVGC